MPKVSICIPTYNNQEELERLLNSIWQQTYSDYEIIISDDSDDAKIEDYVADLENDKIQYIHNIKKLGHVVNWNAAIKKATGEYIKIMFSDDWFTYPESLGGFVNMLDMHTQAGMAFSNNMQVSNETSYQRIISENFVTRLQEDWRHIFLGNEIGAPSDMIYRRNGIMFDETSNWASDVDLYLQLLQKNPCFTYTEKPLISIGLHQEQYTHLFKEKDERIFKDYFYMFQKYKLWENGACKKYFLEEYIIKFKKGLKTANKCHVGICVYLLEKLSYFIKRIVPSYFYAIARRMRVNHKRKR